MHGLRIARSRRGLLLSVLMAVVVAVAVSATAVLPAAARTNKAVGTHKLIVAVKKTLAPALAIGVQIKQNGSAPAGGGSTASKPLTVILDNSGLYDVKVWINSDSCTGSCEATRRVSGSTNHKLLVVPRCQLTSSGSKGSRFVCSRVKIVKVY